VLPNGSKKYRDKNAPEFGAETNAIDGLIRPAD
jgi:hypothetical protein